MLSVLRWIWLPACCLLLSGCWPAGPAPLDEQKESNFLTGKARAQDRDFDGAIESFEKALEVDPHSASAHFELAIIYDQQKNDYAAALYHYEKARRLRPNGWPSDIARDRLEVCKRELAKTVTQTPTVEYMQRELDRLMMENQQLRQRVLEWQNHYQGGSSPMPALITNLVLGPGSGPLAAPQLAGRAEGPRPGMTSNTGARDPAAGSGAPAPSPAAPRAHKIAAGDTPSKIASRYAIKLSSLRAANPGMDERRLRVGQTLVIPAQ
jgi:tetratricopeptide (TPR) repeat protein